MIARCRKALGGKSELLEPLKALKQAVGNTHLPTGNFWDGTVFPKGNPPLAGHRDDTILNLRVLEKGEKRMDVFDLESKATIQAPW